MSAAVKIASRPEVPALAAYLRTCDAGNSGRYFNARYRGECAVTRAIIKPYMQILAIDDHAFARRDALQILDVRGNDTLESVLDRFSWADPERAAEWLTDGATVLLWTASTLKPKVVCAEPKLFCATLDEVTRLYWRSVAFMTRRAS